MIEKQHIVLLLDQVMTKSHNHRVFVGRIPKRVQEAFLGQFFGDVVLRISETEQTISELRKTKNGYISFKHELYEVRATFKANKPLLSKYDCASSRAKKTILNLMREYRSSQPQLTSTSIQ